MGSWSIQALTGYKGNDPFRDPGGREKQLQIIVITEFLCKSTLTTFQEKQNTVVVVVVVFNEDCSNIVIYTKCILK